MQNEHWISLEEYHEIERNSEAKYEYSDGHVYEMSGETFAHSRIVMNIIFKLHAHLRDKTCKVANSIMKVLPLDGENPSYFADVTVTCNPNDYQDDSMAIHSPRLIIEVLSLSTFARDRGEKFHVYLACPTVEEYVMVSSHHQGVEVYRRKSANTWENIEYTAGEVVTLASVGLTMSVAEIYAQTEVLPLGPPESVLYAY
jgi:Uma2 family endonuclease